MAGDAFSDVFRDWAVGIASGGDSTAAHREDTRYPVLADSAIVFSADPALCATAARQHPLAAGEDKLASLLVHLLRLGTYRMWRSMASVQGNCVLSSCSTSRSTSGPSAWC